MNRVLSFVLLSVALLESGCSIAPYRAADISKNPELVHLEVKSLQDAQALFQDVNAVYDSDRDIMVWTARAVRWDHIQDIEFGSGKTVSVKYHRSLLYPAPNVYVPVEFPSGRKYFAWLDTGFSGNILLTSDIVLANKLPIFPFKGHTFQGICRIPELKVGSMCLKEATGAYHEQQWQFRVMNVPIYRHPTVILGLGFIASFDSVLFDNVNKEVVFSKDGPFEPDSPERWSCYPFEIRPDSIANDRIMVRMPIAGQTRELFFDSCGDKPGLRLNQADWEGIEPYTNVKKLRRTHHYSYQKGRLPCQIATVSEIRIGEKAITDAKVRVHDAPEALSLISLGYFQDTVVVLDFVNKLLWVRS